MAGWTGRRGDNAISAVLEAVAGFGSAEKCTLVVLGYFYASYKVKIHIGALRWVTC